MKKKGNMILDSIIVIVILFLLTLTIVVVNMIVVNFNEGVQKSDADATTKAITQTSVNNFPNVMDNIFATAFILLWIAVIVSSFMTDTHPIFFIFSIILFIIVIIYGMIMSNAEQAIIANASMIAYASGLTKTNFIMKNLAKFIIAVGITITIALFGKTRGQQ